MRLTKTSSLSVFVGIIDDSFLAELEKNIKKIREGRVIQYIESIKEDWME